MESVKKHFKYFTSNYIVIAILSGSCVIHLESSMQMWRLSKCADSQKSYFTLTEKSDII